MRRQIVGGIFLAVISLAGFFVIPGALAMTAPGPIGLAPPIQQTSPLEHVQYACPRVWRCGPYGCGWRRECPGGPAYGGRYYRGYGGGAYGGAVGGGWNTWNGCPPTYTIQDGVCKPYMGGYGGGWNTWNGCPPGYTIQGGRCLPYRGPVYPQ